MDEHSTRLVTSFQDSLGKPVPSECQTIPEKVLQQARGGRGGGAVTAGTPSSTQLHMQWAPHLTWESFSLVFTTTAPAQGGGEVAKFLHGRPCTGIGKGRTCPLEKCYRDKKTPYLKSV